MSVIDWLRETPDSTGYDIAIAQKRTVAAVSSELTRLRMEGKVVVSGKRGNTLLYRVNTMPFGCGNPLTYMFNQLLRQTRDKNG